MTPFLRLALVASCAGLILGLVELARWRSWWEALLVGVVGLTVAAGLYEISIPVVTDDPNRPRTRKERMASMPWNRVQADRQDLI